MTFTMMSSCR